MFIKPKIKELLEQLSQTNYGVALKEYLEEAKKELNDVSTIESYEDTLGRKKALKVIDDLFKFMEVKKTQTASKNQYE